MKNKKKRIILNFISVCMITCLVTIGYLTIKKDKIKITVKDEVNLVHSYSKTVEDLLKENNIKYDEDDIIKPSLNTKLKDNMNIDVTYVQRCIVSEHERINYKTKVVKDNSLPKGINVVSQQGKIGRKTVVYEEIYHDDELISRKVEKETIRENPIEKIVTKGTNATNNYVSNPAYKSANINTGKRINVSATAYSGGTVTATGTRPRWGTIAVDPRMIPYGSKVYIPKFNMTFVAEDCGGGIKGNRIDIYMNSSSQCFDWGVRNIDIYILN